MLLVIHILYRKSTFPPAKNMGVCLSFRSTVSNVCIPLSLSWSSFLPSVLVWMWPLVAPPFYPPLNLLYNIPILSLFFPLLFITFLLLLRSLAVLVIHSPHCYSLSFPHTSSICRTFYILIEYTHPSSSSSLPFSLLPSLPPLKPTLPRGVATKHISCDLDADFGVDAVMM